VSGLVALLCAIVAGSLSGAAAWGAVRHEYLSQITEVPASSGAAQPGPLGEVDALAVDSGSLYGAEQAQGLTLHEQLDEFDASSGAFERQFALPSSLQAFYFFGLAAGHATGQEQVYVGAEDNESKDFVTVFDGEGHLLGSPWPGTPSGPFSLAGIGGIAADNRASGLGWSAGDVYVSDRYNKVVDVFKPSLGNAKEEYITQIEGPEPGVRFGEPSLVAVNQSNGDVVVVDNDDVVDIFEPTALGSYVLVNRISGTPGGPFHGIEALGKALAVDSNGDIYVGENYSEPSVFEFDEKGKYLGRLTGTPVRPFHRVDSLTVDPATHEVYVGDGANLEGSIDVFGPDLVVPDVTTGPASEVRSTSATISGTVNPDDAGEASCQFAWGTSAELGNTTPCPAPIPNGERPVEAQQTLTGLTPDTTYDYRLQASNENGLNPGEPYQDEQFHTSGPGIRQEWTTHVASTSVTLGGSIDPNGASTTYYFQYGTTTGYGTDIPAPPGASIGSGSGEVTVGQHVQELLPSTTYHYRIVVRSQVSGEAVEFTGPDQTFTTRPKSSGFALPDRRAWEMVSPPSKDGATLETPMTELGSAMQASVNGDAVSYTANGPTEDEPPGNRASEPTQLFSRRSGSGWGTQVITTHFSEVGNLPVGFGSEYQLFSADLSMAALFPFVQTTLSSEATERTPYLRHNFTCEANPETCYEPLVTASNVEPAGVEFGPHSVLPVLGTPDLSHIIIETGEVKLLPGGENEAHGTYEWADGKLQLVTILPDGKPAPNGGFIGDRAAIMRHAISDDGSRVVFEAEDFEGKRHLYTRDMARGETAQVDAAEPGASRGVEEPEFQLASGDGSKIFFMDAARLTLDSTASGPAYPSMRDLYEFDASTNKLTDLTVDSNPGERANVQGAVQGASEDGSYVYFAADGVLAPGARPARCEDHEASGSCNLYVRHDGVTTFIATLSAQDQDFAEEAGVNADLESVTARVSPNGRWFAFMSDRSLTGYDNLDANSGEPDEEVFLYDASTNHLSCVSCTPTGGRPVGMFETTTFPNLGPLVDRTDKWSERWLAASIPGWAKAHIGSYVYQSRYLSDTGRLFFTSNDALVPQDVNGVMDVYELEPEGVGDCTNANATFVQTAGGCVNLISSGGSTEESAFMDASESGNDVFFLTAAKLRPEDYDNALDVYDARVCTSGSPCIPVPQTGPPPCSTGDSCKAAPSSQPAIFGAPPSATFSGIGEVPTGSSSSVTHRSLMRAQKLTRALQACRRQHGRRRRVACERRARRRYGLPRAKGFVMRPRTTVEHQRTPVRRGR
jgi:hypothetical protein